MKRRNTPNKEKVLELFGSSDEAICSSMLEEKLKSHMDRSTIYRILQSFEHDGLIHKILDPSGKTFYALCNECTDTDHSHNHFHFKCKKCEKVECLEAEVKIPNIKGYVIDDFFAVLDGYCQECA